MLEPRRPPSPRDAIARGIDLVADDLERVEAELRRLLDSTVAILPAIGDHVIAAGGKRLRPLLTLLAAAAADAAGDARITVAAVGELIHTATLLHDDVVDTGEFRRGRPSARLHFGNGLAVLAGDFCLARALQAIASTRDPQVVSRLAETVTRMAEGEIAQLANAGDPALDRPSYYAIIDGKTAELFAWCAAVGGLARPEIAAPLGAFGRELGYAFQIADDVLDYSGSAETSGKTPARDLRDGKVTLPLLLACEADEGLAARVQRALRAGPPLADDEVGAILERVWMSDALAATTAIAEGHAQAAIAHLDALGPSLARDALVELTAGVARRSR
ncbi:MAG: polyprenyl synthetase family protein [Myxococcales bacterium]|nr:polyprenyl synthetase family protein [Myxococcales bacterium]MCB9702596.1 polyprenyl synthetase family protein [Myxococcales bacterium]